MTQGKVLLAQGTYYGLRPGPCRSTTLGDDKNQLLHESNAHLVFVNCHLQCWCNQYTVIYLMQMPSLFSRVFTASATDEDGDEGDEDDDDEADDERNGWV